MDAVSLSSRMSGTRRTRAGVVAVHAEEDGASRSSAEEEAEFHATPALPPVSRAKQASVMAASFLTIALTIGYNQSYGVFQEYYVSESQNMLQTGPDPPTALLAFVGTLAAGLTWSGSIFVNPLLSRLEHAVYFRGRGSEAGGESGPAPTSLLVRLLSARWITFTGVVLMAVGFLLASFSTQVWQVLLTQGLLYGLGSSMLYFPLLGPAPEYFTRHRGTALGIILSGGGVGSVLLSPALRALLSAVGGRWTLRVLAGVYLVLGSPIAWAVPSSRFPVVTNDSDRAMRRRTHISAALLVTPAFLFSVAAAFCQSASAQVPLSFIPSYTVSLGHTASTGATLLAVANVVNSVARIISGYAGDRFGRLNVLTVSLAVATVAVGALWGLSVERSAYQLWLAFIVLYSAAVGGYNALFPATIADVFGIRSYAAVNGFIYFVRGCGTMLGSPVGGVLLGVGGGSAALTKSYSSVVYWDGALLVSSAVCIVGVRWADAVRRGWVWRA